MSARNPRETGSPTGVAKSLRRRGDRGTRIGPFAYSFLLLSSLMPRSDELRLPLVAIAIAAPLIIGQIWSQHPKIHPAAKFTLPLFACIAFPALLHHPETAYGQEKLIRFLSFTLLSALAASLLTRIDSLYSAAKAWVTLMLIPSLAMTLGFTSTVAGRASAFGTNPIWLSRALASAIIMLAWLAINRRISPLLFIPTLGILTAGILLAETRGPLVGAALGLTMLVLFSQRSRAAMILGSTLGGIFLYLSATYLGYFSESRIGQFIADPVSELNGSARSTLLEITWPVLRQNPGGVGFGNWKDASGSPVLFWPHNLFVEVISEAGWFPGAVLLIVLAKQLYSLARKSRQSNVCTLALALLASEAFAVSVSGDLNARTFFSFLTLAYVVTRPSFDNPDEQTISTPVQLTRAVRRTSGIPA